MRLVFVLLLLIVLSIPGTSHADPAQLKVAFGTSERVFTQAQLLARSDAATLTVPSDVAYGMTITYRAVPLLALLEAQRAAPFDTLEASATDGFVSQIPLALVRRGSANGAVAWVAVEDPAHPWPRLSGKNVSAGPFYLVWEHPERSGVTSEQWPYALASLTGVESPAHRWPQIAVVQSLPTDAPARRGQDVFIAQCMPCHRMHGGGAADVGPDLGRPIAAAKYLTEAGLRALIRDPKAVRTWPEQRMVGFDTATLPETDLTALIAYLSAMAGGTTP